jgi:T4 RnlA family RNA ligase
MHLYDELMALVADGETFYFQDFDLEDTKYRIFNYRLSSYTDFMKPSALECRGIMFEVDGEGRFIRLASRTMQKFFNLNENPMTMGLDLSKVDTVELKADGSLISTYTHKGALRLKSRGSLFSEQAIDAMKWLELPQNVDFKAELLDLDNAGLTVNLEWCAPHNRIVIGYPEPNLTILNVRDRETGEYLSREAMELAIQPSRIISRVNLEGLDPAHFVELIPAMQNDIEGYVAHIGDLWFKVKTDKYCSLHHAKDSINNPRRLFEAVVDEGVDDLRSMFVHDTLAMQTIDQMQIKVNKLYNHMVVIVESFYESNKHLDRKDYAIKGRDPEAMDQMYFGLAMNKYIGREVNYKDFLKGKYKELGFKDEKVQVE